MKFGDRVRMLRKRRGWTQPMLADFAGISIMTVVRIEQGYLGLTMYTVMQVAAALDISLSELFRDVDTAARG